MPLALRISTMTVRVSSVVVILLGILLWTGNFDSLRLIHMFFGIVIVLGLWTVGVIQAVQGGSPVLSGAAFVWGAIVVFVGLKQEQWAVGNNHWLIQVMHLLFGLVAISLVEIIGARANRRARQVVS
jgi:hypothetical protein